ncbi:MAG: hypothetical protein M3R41_03815 [Pseudomonadota bacterium]|nr:hypothetical protein [Pseudomonadota bacterium]
MNRKHYLMAGALLGVVLGVSAVPSSALAKTYPAGERPAGLEPFLTDTSADETALALTAAPASITSHAEVMTLGHDGYAVVRKGTNGFVCLVDRSWVSDVTDGEFWNARVRQPACYNPAAVRSVLPAYLERTRWVLAGASMSQIETRTRAEVAQGRIKPPEQGAMIYMMSRQGYLDDVLSKHPHPHLMFFLPKRGPEALGANQPGVPVFSADGQEQPFAIFFVLVPVWSDGTPSPPMTHVDHGEHVEPAAHPAG